MKTISLVFAVAIVFAFESCGDPASPVIDPPPDSAAVPDTSSRPDTMKTVAVFGRYTITPFDSVAPTLPTNTTDGPFVSVVASSKNDRVGTINGRLAVWPAGAGAPTYMFRADTTTTLTAVRINTRLEVVLTRPGAPGGIHVWRDGALKQVGVSQGSTVGPFNNRGTIVFRNSTSYNYFSIVRSPFDADTTVSTRVKGTCARSQRNSVAIALNDQNEVLGSGPRSLGSGGGPMWIAIPSNGDWQSGPCVDLDSLTAKLPINGSIKFTVLGETGLISGVRGDGITTAVLTDGRHIATIDDLLANPGGSQPWHVTEALSIDKDGIITARAFRNPDPTTLLVKLTPEAK